MSFSGPIGIARQLPVQSSATTSFQAALLLLCAVSAGGCSPAGTAVGVAAKTAVVASQARGLQTGLGDHRIWLELNHLLLQESETLFRQVNLQVHDSRVLMSGNVGAPEGRITASRLAWQVSGVQEVLNEIEVSDRSSLANFARDELIVAELEAKLLLDREVTSINFSIEAQNQVIYLIGIARDEVELDRVVSHAKQVAYVRRIVSYVTLRAQENQPA